MTRASYREKHGARGVEGRRGGDQCCGASAVDQEAAAAWYCRLTEQHPQWTHARVISRAYIEAVKAGGPP